MMFILKYNELTRRVCKPIRFKLEKLGHVVVLSVYSDNDGNSQNTNKSGV